MFLHAIVEIPKNSSYKYEFSDGELVLDRVLNQAIPYNYGYIPNTLCEDNDPLDVFIISSKPIMSLTKVNIKIIGAFVCKDKGEQDDKLIGILEGEDVTPNFCSIRHYLNTYKEGFKILNEINAEEAYKLYERSKK